MQVVHAPNPLPYDPGEHLLQIPLSGAYEGLQVKQLSALVHVIQCVPEVHVISQSVV